MSQIGVPYSWGGGNAAGPSKGIDSGAGMTGFDCSGLVLYSFAGVGIKLPHYSGSQYNMGRKIPSSQMRRGDVIFYGPGGSQHVTLYLGDGQMLEAPDIGSEGARRAGAHQRHDALRGPVHRMVRRGSMRRKAFRAKRSRLINLACIATVVTGLMFSVAAPATADPGAVGSHPAGSDQRRRAR